MLFLADVEDRRYFTAETPPTLAADLAAFDGLLAKHCASGTFGSRQRAATRARAAALLALLGSLLALLECALTPGAKAERGEAPLPAVGVFAVSSRGSRASAAGDAAPVFAKSERTSAAKDSGGDADELVAAAARLRVQQPALTRDLLARLLKKCSRAPLLKKASKCSAVLDASEAAVQAEAQRSRRSCGGGGASPGGSPGEAAGEGAAACASFFNLVHEAVNLGGKFSVVRLLELQQSARRWTG